MYAPTFVHERELIAAGHFVIGVDEAGCGCLAGPVVAAAVQLPLGSRLALVRDSKFLSPAQRERLFAEFERRGYRWAIGVASVEEIDRLNIRKATYLAMERAVCAWLAESGIKNKESWTDDGQTYSRIYDPSFMIQKQCNMKACSVPMKLFCLVDAWTIPNLPIPQRAIVHGDRLVKSIAAASIIAKVTRDHMMDDFDRAYPAYGFSVHKGYATRQHREAIRRHGPSVVHRLTFRS